MANGLKVDHGLLRAVWDHGTLAGLDDRALLARFVEDGSQLAFEGLVRRHGPMVLRVCSQLLGDRHAAEDAFQAVFLVLARRAGSIRGPERLAPWLHGVALRTARESRKREARRKRIEQRGATMSGTSSHPPDRPAIRLEQAEALHREVAKLPERYRAPVVLCDLEGLTHQEAAAQLRCPVGTVTTRLTRARERLRDRLTRRGIDPNAGLLAVSVGSNAHVPILSPTLIEATVRASTTVGLASASAISLAQGVQMTMTIARWKTITAGAVMTLGMAATWGVAVGARPNPDDKPAQAAPAWKVEKAVVREVRDFEDFNGVTRPSRFEEARSRYSGRLEKALVEVGAKVKAGDVLFEFESKTLRADVEAAAAELNKAKAQESLAKSVTARNARLKAKRANLVSTEEIQRAEAELASSVARVARTNADARRAGFLLEGTKVRAPFDGIIAERDAVVGNEYQDKHVFAKVVALDPIAVEFQVDERTLLKIRRAYGDDKKALESLPIRITFPFVRDFAPEARLESIADRLDPATATTLFRTLAPNPDRLARAQMLVQVRLTTGPPRQALVVPASAIMKKDQGTIVYAVDDQDIIRERTVKLGQPLGEVREIREGLSAGDRVLTGDLKGVQAGTPLKP